MIKFQYMTRSHSRTSARYQRTSTKSITRSGFTPRFRSWSMSKFCNRSWLDSKSRTLCGPLKSMSRSSCCSTGYRQSNQKTRKQVLENIKNKLLEVKYVS